MEDRGAGGRGRPSIGAIKEALTSPQYGPMGASCASAARHCMFRTF